MSLKDLLPEGTYEELQQERAAGQSAATARTAQHSTKSAAQEPARAGALYVTCPQCGRRIVYDVHNPWRPFCSQRCKLLDLGAWASEERRIKGPSVLEDEDADLLNTGALQGLHSGEPQGQNGHR